MSTLKASRRIPAAAEQVFAAFQPERLVKWWGPAGFTNTFTVCEFRSGGRWSLVMHGPDGTNYDNESLFAEVDPPVRIVIDHLSNPRFRLTIDLTPEDGETLVSWSQTFATEEIARAVERIAGPGNEQNLARLEAEVLTGGEN